MKLELGVLYYRLGSYETARTYLESARGSGLASPEVKDRASQYLKEVDSKVSKSQFSGDVLVGLGYSSNANSGAGGANQSMGRTVRSSSMPLSNGEERGPVVNSTSVTFASDTWNWRAV